MNMEQGTVGHLSQRGSANVAAVMSRVPKAILDGGHDTSSIDLSFAENCVIQDEVLNIYQQTMEKTLRTEVSANGVISYDRSIRLIFIQASFFSKGLLGRLSVARDPRRLFQPALQSVSSGIVVSHHLGSWCSRLFRCCSMECLQSQRRRSRSGPLLEYDSCPHEKTRADIGR